MIMSRTVRAVKFLFVGPAFLVLFAIIDWQSRSEHSFIRWQRGGGFYLTPVRKHDKAGSAEAMERGLGAEPDEHPNVAELFP
jgi:hypothetical protein